MIRRVTGQSMLLQLCTRIIVPNTVLLGTPLFPYVWSLSTPTNWSCLGSNFWQWLHSALHNLCGELADLSPTCSWVCTRECKKKKTAKSNRKRYDVGPSPGVLLPGNCVLVRNLSLQGKNMLKDCWEDVPYEVLQRISGLPIYVVHQEGTGKRRTLHRNLLLPYHIPHEKEPPK